VLSGAAQDPGDRARSRRPCRRSTSGWCAASTRSSSFSTRPSTSRTWTRLHPRLRAGGAGERRAVHPRGSLGGDGLCRTRRGRARLGVADHDQPGEPRAISGRRRRDLQGGALRRRRRRLCAQPAHRPRRLELVHRLGGLDVPADRRIAARPAARTASICIWRPACPWIGQGSGSTTAIARRPTTSP
jgi:hypothetical protein